MIVATAGHVDHGKTSLVRNLTGVETDRLEEERRRGLSISLGYAYWQPEGCDTVVGFIDVPGHRRFINNMISGISGIDLGMLVVAADDGPMPQTREHLQVMELLGVERYVLVVSKCDRVDDQRVDEVCAQAASLLPADTPLYKVSNTTEAGIEELAAELGRQASEWAVRSTTGRFRMSVDRAFNLQGSGLVLTGTIASGRVATGDSLLLQPQGQALRVRGIHTQDNPAQIGNTGERCALDVSGSVHKDDIERGDWVVADGTIGTTSRFDTRIRLLPGAAFPLKHLTTVKLHIGAKHLEARMLLLREGDSERTRIKPGETALAQFVTDRPVHCCNGDRFLLRDHGETATLGGGIVLDPVGREQHKATAQRIAFLRAMENPKLEVAITEATSAGCILDYEALLAAWNAGPGEQPGSELPDIVRPDSDNRYWLSIARWTGIKSKLFETLGKLHEQQPDEPGIVPARLARAAMSADERHLFDAAISELVESGDILSENGLLAAKDFQPDSAPDDDEWLAIANCLRKHGVQIPKLPQLEQECGLGKAAFKDRLDRARRDRQVIRLNPQRYAETSLVNDFAQVALRLAEDSKSLTVAELRDSVGCGRNVLIDVLEYFDSIGFTRRVGNARMILNRELPEKQFTAR